LEKIEFTAKEYFAKHKHYNYLPSILKQKLFTQKLLKMSSCENWLERPESQLKEGEELQY